MLIKSIKIKNFKSFGNLPQTLDINTEKGELVLSPNCPACRYDYGKGTLQMCPECGASRPMIKT